MAEEKDLPGNGGVCKPGFFGWKRFDQSAYEEAIKSPNQIQKKQKERDEEVTKLLNLIQLYKGKGREKGTSEDGEEEDFIPGGFEESQGDPRFSAMKRIHSALAVADGTDPEKIYSYGISQAALRGYEELRQEWNRVVASGDVYSEEKAKKLKECIVTYQRQHREDMGDSHLFEELIKEDNWVVWREANTAIQTERIAKRFSTNIVRDYLRYCDLLDELEHKQKPIQYTPADARDSRRLFDFKGGSQGGFRHDASRNGLSFTTQIAVKSAASRRELWQRKQIRIHYNAPRLLRDNARVLLENEDLKSANWIQPLMRALGTSEDDKHKFDQHAVSLMPSWKPGVRSDEPDSLLLNFVLSPKEDKFIEHLRAGMGRSPWPWPFQYNFNGEGRESTLRWQHEDWSKVASKKGFPGKWFTDSTLTSFRLLSVDLGQKYAGAYAIIEVSCELATQQRKLASFIGTTEHNGIRRDWFARVVTTGLLKLPGEDAVVYRPEFEDGKPADGSGAFRQELSGSAGRLALEEETKQTIALLTEMKQLDLLGEDLKSAEKECSNLTFPDQNNKLLVAFRRAQTSMQKLHRWCWFLDPQDKKDRRDHGIRRRAAIREIANSEGFSWLDAKVVVAAQKINADLGGSSEAAGPCPEISEALRLAVEGYLAKLKDWLETIANRIYRSRGGRLLWTVHPEKSDCFLLDFSPLSKEDQAKLSKSERMLSGQRGLSIARIEQLEELRKRCQSLNQMMRRKIGHAPPMSRDDSVPDPCPTILAKLENIKEQRQNQTAHMILAQALGLTLRESRTPKNKKTFADQDLNGEYVKADDRGRPIASASEREWRGVVDFIVIEDLSRYRTSQGRAPRENSRLMKWCHRAVRDKLKQMCEPFGIPLIETPAAYSSRFCSRTGVAGFRASEISGNPFEQSKWRWRVRKPRDGMDESTERKKQREQWESLFKQVQEVNGGRDGRSEGKAFRTLLVPDPGGSIFVPISSLDGNYLRADKDPSNPKLARSIIRFAPITDRDGNKKYPQLIHADINAAIILGQRAVSDPRIWSLHPRLRSERQLGSGPQTVSGLRKRGRLKSTVLQQDSNENASPDRFWISSKETRKYSQNLEKDRIEIRLVDKDKANLKAADSRHPNFFEDVANLKTWVHDGAAELKVLPEGYWPPTHLVSGKALWGYVKAESWKRCEEINKARLDAWKRK